MADIFDDDYWSKPFSQLRTQVDINVWFRSSISKLATDASALRTEFNSRVGNLETTVPQHSSAISDIRNSIDIINGKINSLASSYDALKSNNDSFISNINKTITDFRTDLSNITGSVNSLMASVNKNSQDILNLQQVVDPKVISQLKQTYDQLLTQLQSISKNTIETDINPRLDIIQNAINTEVNRATAQEGVLSDRITALNSRVNTQQQTIDDNYSSLNNSFTNLTKKVNDNIQCISNSLDDEIERANSAEVCLKECIAQEKKDRIDADNNLCNAINEEKKSREDEDTSIRKSIIDLGTIVTNNYNELKDSDKAINNRLDDVNTNIAKVNENIDHVNTEHDGMKKDISKNATDISSLSVQVAENVNNIKNNKDEIDEWADTFQKSISEYYGKVFLFDDLPSLMAAPMKFRNCGVSVTNGSKTDTNLNISIDNDIQFYAINNTSAKQDNTNGSLTVINTIQKGRGTVVFNYDRSVNNVTNEEIEVVTTQGKIYYVYFNTIKHDTIPNKYKYIVKIVER